MENLQISRNSSENGCIDSGKAWVAVNATGEIVAFRMMGNYALASIAEAMERAGKKRDCKAAEKMQERMNTESFQAWRIQARAELAELAGENGKIISGVIGDRYEEENDSGKLFYPNPKY